MLLKQATTLAGITLMFAVGLPATNLLHTRGVQFSPIQRDPRFDAVLRDRFERFRPSLNFRRAIGVVAIPMADTPVRDMYELEYRWTTIGGLYVPSRSPRLKLAAGAYRVQVTKTSGEWRARFTDEQGKVRGEVPAEVEQADPVPIPLATDEHSVCYRFDRTRVCV